jgi:hypothetical protein
MIKEIVDLILDEIEALNLGFNIQLTPSTEYLPKDAFDNLPKLILQGPTLTNKFISYDPVAVSQGNNEYGIEEFKQWLSTTDFDIEFRLRYINDKLRGGLDDLEKLIKLGTSIVSVEYDSVIYNVDIQENWTDTVMPNFSDLKHFESRLIIEQVKIKKDTEDEIVRECVEFNLSAETKED